MELFDGTPQPTAPPKSPTTGLPVPEGMEERNYADIQLALGVLETLVKKYVDDSKIGKEDKTFVGGSFAEFYKEVSSETSIKIPARFINSYLISRGFHFSDRRKVPRDEINGEEAKVLRPRTSLGGHPAPPSTPPMISSKDRAANDTDKI